MKPVNHRLPEVMIPFTLPDKLFDYKCELEKKVEDSKLHDDISSHVFAVIFFLALAVGCALAQWFVAAGFIGILVLVGSFSLIQSILHNRRARVIAKTITPRDRFWIEWFKQLDILSEEMQRYNELVTDTGRFQHNHRIECRINDDFLDRLGSDLSRRRASMQKVILSYEEYLSAHMFFYEQWERYFFKYSYSRKVALGS